jgi:microcystin-dependent protein
MAVTQTTRLGITRWDSGTDAFDRAQNDEDHANLEQRVGMWLIGQVAIRPSASAYTERLLWLDPDTGILSFSDGTSWFNLNQGLDFGLVGAVADVGTVKAAGTNVRPARVDHVHTLGTNAVSADAIAAGAVGTAELADNAVTPPKLAGNAVETAKIADGAVTRPKLAPAEQTPTGAILFFAGNTLPTGYLWAEGATVLRSSYPALADVLGVAGGATSYTLPNLTGRFPLGASGAHVSGVAGGAEQVTLTIAQLATHTHTATITQGGTHDHNAGTTDPAGAHQHAGSSVGVAGSHDHAIWAAPVDISGLGSSVHMFPTGVLWGNPGNAGQTGMPRGGPIFPTWPDGAHIHGLTIAPDGGHVHGLATDSAGSHTHSITIDPAGGNNTAPPDPVPTMPPFYVGRYIIKY